ncbi:hypothetical protein FCULG_00007151 [Fusarium culmorum]|uniref:Uncharacterized protein n=1 Tax=Fusarium culmorum TaxID=5516 RepID=A0A2T4GTK3_FUSCU|nr:hypothetical protein FCULG_00007151 [Fusarium culmorum]
MAPKQPNSNGTPIFSTSIFSSNNSSSRPTTREGSLDPLNTNILPKDRKASFSRKASLGSRRGSSLGTNAYVTDAAAPPALPDYALSAAAKVAPRPYTEPDVESERDGVDDPSWGVPSTPLGFMPNGAVGTSGMWQQNEASIMYHHITELANKRIATLEYLRKAHEGRIYWFKTYLFDRTDLGRMPSLDARKLGRKATNHLLLGLSLPTIVDLYSSTSIEFLRSLNSLLSEFDSFQQLHGESSTAASLTRARLPSMFRRPGGKSRRSTSAADMHPLVDEMAPMPSAGALHPSETDLLPGEEYTYLLTPSLPFDPDYFETFATLCDVLIDCYTRFLALVPSPKDCSAPVAELFTKADSRVRKIIVQGLVRDFEEQSRSHVKTEVATIGKVVLGV